MSTSFDVEVRQGLEARRGQWRALAMASGVSYSWISQFVRKKIPNPGYETLKALNQALGQCTPAKAFRGAEEQVPSG